MNAPDLLDYVLGQLDGDARIVAEREIAADPRLAATAERLGRAVHRLADDGDPIVPPPGLAHRTVAFVAERRRHRTILDLVPARVPFRWADFGVAAGIFLAGVLTLVPALRRSQQQMDQAGCSLNLRQLGTSLAQYAAQHGHYPYAPSGHTDAPTGTFAVVLHDSDLLQDPSALDCPCNGRCARAATMPPLDSLKGLNARSPQSLREMICWDYAYNPGYRHESGQVGPVPAKLSARIPLLADQPAHQAGRILEGNSLNHDGRGQNVLFTDSHVSWHDSRRVSPDDPDLYLNAQHLPGPGVNVLDAALVPSLCPFRGW